jgi:hypothetical protein
MDEEEEEKISKLTENNVFTRFSAPGRFPLFTRLTASSRLFNCQTTKKMI